MFDLSEKSYFWRGWIIVISALLAAGFIYRGAAAKQQLIVSQTSSITIPLKQFPLKLNEWLGKDIPTEIIEETTGCDDYLFRLYRNSKTGEYANVYVTFCAQPRKMLGHRPEVCFTASGWDILHDQKIHIATTSGKTIPCIKYLFEKPVGLRDEFTVLNFYILNGRLTEDHKEFSGIKWRTLANPKEQVRYVTQIQISSSNEEAAISAAKEISDLIIKFFPDEHGQVKASLVLGKNNSK